LRSPSKADAYALHYLGLLEAGAGRFESATPFIDRSIELQPSNAQFRENYATILYQARRYELAVQLCDEGLRSNQVNVSLLYVSALALFKLKRLAESLQRFDRLLTLQPDHLAAINERGIVLAEMREHSKALAAFQKAISLNPTFADAHVNMANLLGKAGRHQEAKSIFEKALALNPKLARAWSGLGNTLREHHRFGEALAAFDKALALESELAETWLGRGTALYQLKRFDDAFASYDGALALMPDLAEAWLGRGNALHRLKRHAEAAQSFVRLLKLQPEYPFAKGMLLHQKIMTCDWSGIAGVINEIERDLDLGGLSAEPFGWQAVSSSPRSLLRCAELFNAAKFPADVTVTPARPHEHKKIRIGYLGDVFREQAVSYLMVGALELADKSRFELYGFDNGRDDKSETRKRVEASLTEMIDIRSRDDISAAAAIREREIDILVNLNVYFGDHRTGVLAKRPAPVQANYLGFPATLGASYSDYIIADRWIIPPADRDFYSEKSSICRNAIKPTIARRRFHRASSTGPSAACRRTGLCFAASITISRLRRMCSIGGCAFCERRLAACCGWSTTMPASPPICATRRRRGGLILII
jgi:predicted O-linked N-acetylglucosamine transferase (SPINDLY family)